MTHPSSCSAQCKDLGYSLRAHQIYQTWTMDTDPVSSFKKLMIYFTIETPVISSDSSSIRVRNMISDRISVMIKITPRNPRFSMYLTLAFYPYFKLPWISHLFPNVWTMIVNKFSTK